MIRVDLPHAPSHICLDAYLAQGWFRTGSVMAYSPLIAIQGDVFATVPIRILLTNYKQSKSLRRIARRNGGTFRVEVATARSDAARETLYQATAERFAGYRYETLAEMLEAEPFGSLFETREVSVWDGDRLIASSYFDVGNESVASLLGLYDPAYRRYGLGIYTMLVEIADAIENGRKFYYPGYIVIGNPWLDYKLRLGNVQYRSKSGRWATREEPPTRDRVCDMLQQRATDMSRALTDAKIPHRRRVYPLFWIEDLGLAHAFGFDPVRAPLFFEVGPNATETGAWIVEVSRDDDAAFVVTRAAPTLAMNSLIDGSETEEVQHPAYVYVPLERQGETQIASHVDEVIAAVSQALRETPVGNDSAR